MSRRDQCWVSWPALNPQPCLSVCFSSYWHPALVRIWDRFYQSEWPMIQLAWNFTSFSIISPLAASVSQRSGSLDSCNLNRWEMKIFYRGSGFSSHFMTQEETLFWNYFNSKAQKPSFVLQMAAIGMWCDLAISLHFLLGFSSEATPLTQTDDRVSVAVGQTTSISCTLEGVEFISGNHPSWYRQKMGNPPQPLIYNARERASGIPDRFSGETYGNRATLTIARTQADDEGDYYCAVWHSSAFHVDPAQCGSETKILCAFKSVTQASENKKCTRIVLSAQV